MRTGYPPIKKTGAPIAVYLAVCMLVYCFFGFGFYRMFQSRQFPNPGLAAYKPPPATAIIYVPTGKLIYGEPASSETAAEEHSHGTPDEATRAYASATPLITEPPTQVADVPVSHVKREAATRPAKVWRVQAKARQAHSPRADRTASSRTHSEPRSVAAVYPGFAAVR
jgi:hypothetical protein